MKYSKVFIAFAACCVLGVIIYFLANGSLGGGSIPKQEAAPENKATAVEAPTAEQPEPQEKEPQEIGQPDNTGEIGTKLHEILLAAHEYYDDTVNTTQVLTKNGFLYNAAADAVITPEYLVQREYLSDGYTIEGACVLYVKKENVSDIVAAWEDYSDEMKVYVAAPFEDGYLLDTKSENQAKISNDDFGKLLLSYKSDHGEIRRITGSTDDYGEINNVMKAHQNRSSDFYIRYGMRDDKYAVVIASPKDGYGAIYQYVLEYENNEWNVRIPSLETVPKPKVVINSVCPDLNIELMPRYDVSNYLGIMQKNFQGVTEALVKDGYITQGETEIKYISATDDFLFAKYTNGQMFVGIKTEGTWVLGEATSPENVLNRLKGIDQNAPDFIIIWE